MKGKTRLWAALTAACLTLSLLTAVPVRAAEVCFTAINDRVLELTDDTMPVWSGEVLYVPYTTFDAGDSGMKWSVECSYNRANSMLTVFDIEQRSFLEFDLREGTCYDPINDKGYDQGAILRGGIPYLPVRTVCSHFGLRYSYREIEQGSLLRIKNDEVILSDTKFLDAAQNALALRLREYNQSQNPGEGDGSGSSAPQSPGANGPEGEVHVPTYLALRCTSTELLEGILLTLQAQGERCMFLLTPEVIEQRSDLVLWMVGEGHSVGLLAQGETPEDTRAILAQGSALLARHCFLRTTVAMVPGEQREGLEQEGWVCWDSTLDLTPGENTGANYFASRVLAQLKGRERATCLTISDGADALRVLPTLLTQLAREGFELELPLETKL